MNRRVIQGATLLVIGLLILVGLLRSVHPAEVAQSLRQANLGWILAGAAAFTVFLLVRAWRWQVILQASAPHAGLADATAVTAIGFAVNSVSPFKLGEVVRIAAIAPRAGIGIGEAGATVVLERVLDVLALLLLAVAAAAVSGSTSRSAGLWTGVILFALLSLALGVVAYLMVTYPDRTDRIIDALASRLPARLQARARALGRSVGKGFSALRSPKRLAVTGVLSLVTWLCIVVGLIALFRAVSAQLALGTLFLACTIFVVSQAVSITPGSVGTYEGFFLLVFGTFGAGPPALVTAAAVLGHATNIAVLLTAGAIGALWLRLHPGRMPVRLQGPIVGQDSA